MRISDWSSDVCSSDLVDYSARKILMAEEKRHIAQAAARHVPDGVSLFINIGTTTEAVAQALFDHRGLRVITNNLNVATLLHRNTRARKSVVYGKSVSVRVDLGGCRTLKTKKTVKKKKKNN